jgi:hypothetical protein
VCVALVIQHAKHMRRIVLSSAPACFHHILPHYLINGTFLKEKKKLLNIKYVFLFSLQLLSETFLILRRIQRDTVIKVQTFSCKVPVVPGQILMKLEFSR